MSKWGINFEIIRSKVKVIGNENVEIVAKPKCFPDYFASNTFQQHKCIYFEIFVCLSVCHMSSVCSKLEP